MTLVSTAAKGAGGAAGAETLLSTTTLSVQSQLDVQTISQAYNDLVIVLLLRSARANIIENLALRFNNDSGAHYDYQNLQGVAAATGASRSTAQTSIGFGSVPGSTDTANKFSTATLTLPDYASTSHLKTGQLDLVAFDAGGVVFTAQFAFFWNQASAISRFTIFGTTTANMEVGTTARVYGRL